jgi:hypothetical protein
MGIVRCCSSRMAGVVTGHMGGAGVLYLIVTLYMF